MEFDKVVKNRCSCRNFLNKEVSEKDIQEIIYAGSLAPSAKNRQPWKVKILTAEQKNKIADMLEQSLIINNDEKTGIATANIYRQCSVLLLIYIDELKDQSRNWATNVLSIGAFVENMCLKATSLNIDTLWAYDMINVKDQIKEYLNIDLELISSLCLGYKSSKNYCKKKKNVEDIIIK